MPLLELHGVSKSFHRHGPPAVQDVSLSVDAGECVALVGESGSGKSTLARLALRLLAPDTGQILLDGRDLATLSGPALREARMAVQPVFQDASAAFNPRRRVGFLLRQALRQAGASDTSDGRICALLDQVELRPARELLPRRPNELSGGQRQRLAIARALATRPRIVIADEPLSGADVSIRAQILDLLADLQQSAGIGYLLITHDMNLARAVSSRIAVMHQGRIVETGATASVLHAPEHPYTRRLLDAVQDLDD